MKWGVVIPSGKDRIENLYECLKHISKQTKQPDQIVVVCDGFKIENTEYILETLGINVLFVGIKKHEPGLEQPRNVGVRFLDDDIDYVWFLDSDCIASPTALEKLSEAHHKSPGKKIMIAPYDWLPEGKREIDEELHNDPRWDMLNEFGPETVHIESLGVALGCFSGNLAWPVSDFKKIGGFHNQLNMGRCEDGELGLRASSYGVPMIIVNEARAWHLWHPVDLPVIHEKNKRDVPLINEWHPWVQDKGIVMTARDGIRFERVCPCGEIINTLEWWHHATLCNKATGSK